MDRRNFLHMLGLAGVTLAAPKFIFDMGANLYRASGDIIGQKCTLTTFDSLTKKIWEERLFKDTMAESYFARFLGAWEESVIHPKLLVGSTTPLYLVSP